jgi:hypothetical protein
MALYVYRRNRFFFTTKFAKSSFLECTANEGPVRIQSHLCIPRNETVEPPYFQNRIIMFCLPIPTLIYL